MNYYPHHIGDFDRATRHLSRIERSVYRDLIDLYYDTEEQLTLDTQALCRRIIARTSEEATAVEQVLNEFFTQTPTGWYHDRCEEEIEAYRASTSQKSAAGKASAAKRAAKREQALNGTSTTVATPVERTSNGSATNQEPLTINQEPESIVKPRATRLAKDWVLPDDWAAWAREARPDLDIAGTADRFKDFWVAKAGKDGAKLDWLATWRNWVRNSKGAQAFARRPSVHTGFDKIDYNKGINDDLTFD